VHPRDDILLGCDTVLLGMYITASQRIVVLWSSGSDSSSRLLDPEDEGTEIL